MPACRLARAACLALLCAGCAPRLRPDVPHGRVVGMQFAAPTLGIAGREALVYLPPGYDAAEARARRYPVVYFLHGGPGWEGDWFQHGALAAILDQLTAERRIPPLIAIAADGRGLGRRGRSLWLDSWDGRSRMASYITRDVVSWADSAFRTLPDARDRALVGISDGATGALGLMFRHPGHFGAAAGLSGRYRAHGAAGLAAVAGPDSIAPWLLRANSPLLTAEDAAPGLAGHVLYYDSGVLDLDAWDVAAMDARLAVLGVEHESHLYLGWHDWPFWQRRLLVALPVVTRRFVAGAPDQKP